MELFIAVLVGVVIGRWIQRIWDHITFRSILKDLGVTERQLNELHDKIDSDPTQPELEEIEVKLEEIQGTIYAFRVDNDQFLGQGPDREALIQRLTENLTNVRITIAKENGADLIYRQ